jgi:hypothetical protein
MQAKVRAHRFGFSSLRVALVALVLAGVVAGSAALLLIQTRTTDGSDAQAAVAEARPSGAQTDQSAGQSEAVAGSGQQDTMSQRDLEQADHLAQVFDAKMASLDALGMHMSHHANVTAYPGHPGFTYESTSHPDRATWTTFPSHAGFMN